MSAETQEIHLTTDRVSAAALMRNAYLEQRLVAQSDDQNVYPTYFQREAGTDRVVRCAVGVLFPEDVAERLQSVARNVAGGYLMADHLIREGVLKVPREDEYWFRAVQDRHDQWTGARRNLQSVEGQIARVSTDEHYLANEEVQRSELARLEGQLELLRAHVRQEEDTFRMLIGLGVS